VAAEPVNSDSSKNLLRFTGPKLEAGVRLNHPLPVGFVNEYWTLEGSTPGSHPTVEMRMRDRDRFDSAQQSNDLDGGAVQKANAVPQYIPGRSDDQKGALSNPEPRRRRVREKIWGNFSERVEVVKGQFFWCRPTLPCFRHELARILANNASRWGYRAFRILNPTGCAQKFRHMVPAFPHQLGLNQGNRKSHLRRFTRTTLNERFPPLASRTSARDRRISNQWRRLAQTPTD
jgi:hypothetical protein